MKVLNYGEHTGCVHFDQSAKPQIELVRMAKKVKHTFDLNHNEVIFFLEGRVELISGGFPACEVTKGKMLFLPAGGKYTYLPLTDGVILIFRLVEAVQLCDSFQLERLVGLKKREKQILIVRQTGILVPWK
ncbi:MAG: hypothetical protein LUE93_15275 [Bacteroides sp.]|nr:hypothetical protein [Bacteroides sp.]